MRLIAIFILIFTNFSYGQNQISKDSAIQIAKTKISSQDSPRFRSAEIVELRQKEYWNVKFQKTMGMIKKGYYKGWYKLKIYIVLINPQSGKVKSVKTKRVKFSNFF